MTTYSVIARSVSDKAISSFSLLNSPIINPYNTHMSKKGYVYIITNKANTVLYTGVTSNLAKRVYEHKHKPVKGFTTKYNVTKLVYYEIYDSIEDAIRREKQIKAGSRAKKIKLIESMNPKWKDLYEEIL